MSKKLISLLLALALALGCCSALAENTKHERVYVVTGPDGTVNSITDNIRLENADGLDELLDRTLLTGIENLGGKEPYALDGETLTWQAKGSDISYQGTSDKTPVLLPVVTLTMDGEEITAEELKEKSGEATLTVTYQLSESLPVLAVTVLPLPEKGISELKLENAAVLSEIGRQALVGWAVPGVDEKLKLPASFTASFHADHAELNWMMTLTTADPINAVCRELNERIDLDVHQELDEAAALLTALRDGAVLPETAGKTKDIVPKVTALNEGLTQLDEGAAKLATGAAQLAEGAAALQTGADQVNEGAASLATGTDLLSTNLSTAAEGAATLDTGLAALIENNDALNAGAAQLFAAVLQTANQQLTASGLAEAGITLPELTAENYAEALDAVITNLSAVSASNPAAKAAVATLTDLKAQLDQVNTFVTGLKAYTDGASQAAAGATVLSSGLNQLSEGAVTLHAGAAQLAEGASSLAAGANTLNAGSAVLSIGAATLHTTGTSVMKGTILDAEKSAAEKLLPYVEGDLADALRIFEETRDAAGQGGYDLRPEGMKTVTVYIIRTDF